MNAPQEAARTTFIDPRQELLRIIEEARLTGEPPNWATMPNTPEAKQVVADYYDPHRKESRPKLEPIRRHGKRIGRNDSCPCGSGRKFKLCHRGRQQ